MLSRAAASATTASSIVDCRARVWGNWGNCEGMEPAVAADGGSGNSGEFSHSHHHHREIAETLRFQEEIQSLIRENLLELDPDADGAAQDTTANNSSSFTALLGLPPNQAMELLHPHQQHQHQHHEVVPTLEARRSVVPHEYLQFRCSPTFPSNAALVERAARYSVFASEGSSSPETSAVPSNSGNNSSPKVKSEPADSDSKSPPTQKRANGKRKPSEKCTKPKRCGKKSKNGSGGVDDVDDKKNGGGEEKLPYVHVRARRGQATDSHSLAERARREKINGRMKLLQELVPGCNKISGTALVLDEIINHVQSLQRQVEFLSMRLAAVNPRIDFGGIESFLPSDNATVTRCNDGGVGLVASIWPEIQADGGVRPQQQQIWQVDLLPSQQQTSSSSSLWDRDDNHQNQHHGFISPGPSLIGLDYANPVSVETNQLKTEM